MVAALIISISLVLRLLQTNPELTLSNLVGRSVGGAASFQLKTDNHKDDGPKGKCGLAKPCPGNDYTFKIYSGATNIIGPQICFEGKMIIEKDTRGNRPGINIAVVNVAILNDEARTLIAELGSSYISQLKFRDNWLFVGGKKTITQVTFEQHIKNDRETNKYESWPEMIEMEGCIPRID
ncbi:hypothetical protein cypCar_00021595 [Cyprinus carpio]|nr:hypothetical protein cypCar_00021595 [Cyprinus carpio]